MSKYYARRTVVDGVTFASKKEARRYGELKLLQRAGLISDLKLQPKIRCVVNMQHVCDYIGDFFYIDRKTFKDVYEDAKSDVTRKLPVYRLKKKLVQATTGIVITEV